MSVDNKNEKADAAKIAVAMSGGVDSSVTASLLAGQGYRVFGLTMRLWFDPGVEEIPGRSCCSWQAVNDARRVAEKLDIPHYVINLKEQFKEQVVDYFVEEYLSGRTPNPCVICNRRIKFGLFLEKARAAGADYLATGHYVRSTRDPHSGRYYLRKGRDIHKDQSYMLYNLSQEQLARSIFPLGELRKEEVRQKAQEMGFTVAQKVESQEICFIPEGGYREFLYRQRGEFSSGSIVDTAGRELGVHRGLPYYTVGQRKGLGITSSEPLYVVALNPRENTLVVGTREETFSRELVAGNLNFMKIEAPREALSVKARIRYNAPEVPAILYPPGDNGEARVELEEPQSAVTPGQAVVFYREDRVLGGGIIQSAWK